MADGQVKHGVSQEFETLIVFKTDPYVLIHIGGMPKCLKDQRRVPEPISQYFIKGFKFPVWMGGFHKNSPA
jgi:hypothetical protein